MCSGQVLYNDAKDNVLTVYLSVFFTAQSRKEVCHVQPWFYSAGLPDYCKDGLSLGKAHCERKGNESDF